jgi:DNA-binding CsgD family transcriptional regulator
VASPSSRRYDRVLELAASILDSRDDELPHGLVTSELTECLRSSGSCFLDLRWRADLARVAGISADWATRPLHVLLSLYLRDHPLIRHYRVNDDAAVLTANDLVGAHTWDNSEVRHVSRALLDADQHLAIPLAAPAGVIRMFAVGRPSDPYRDNEIVLAKKIQAVLTSVDNHLHHYRHWRGAQRRPDRPADLDELASEYRLTPRELTVLALLAEPLLPTAIARRLGISHRTVHKHIENLYRKLGVVNRVGAIQRAHAVGLLVDRTGRTTSD